MPCPSEEPEGGILGGVEIAEGVEEPLADAGGGSVEGGDAEVGNVGAVTGTKGAAVEGQAEVALTPGGGGPDEACLGQAYAVVPVGEAEKIGKRRESGRFLDRQGGDSRCGVEGPAFCWGWLHVSGAPPGCEAGGVGAGQRLLFTNSSEMSAV